MQNSIEQFGDFKIIHYEILDSTNTEAKILIDKNNYGSTAENIVVIANQQLAGRGRNGNDWVSYEGNLFCSVIIKFPSEAEKFSFVTALALAKILESFNLKPQIKWANDIKLDGKKISGILLEKHKKYLIIGVGVNILEKPTDLNITATSLGEYGIKITPEIFLKQFLKKFTEIKKQYEKQGFLEIKNEINKNLFHKNKIVTLNYINKMVTGKIIEINDGGNLVLQTPHGYEEFNAGEILNI